jgi:NitT/TauT family transport system substrate-binding protein
MRRMISLTLVAIFTITCGGGVAPGPGTQPSAAGPTAGTALTRLPVRIAVGGDSLSYSTAWTAKGAGLFEKEGLDVTWTPTIADAAQSMALLLSRQTDVLQGNFTTAMAAVIAGRDVKVFAAGAVGYTNFIVISKAKADEFAKAGVTPQSPIADRIRALRGLRIGTGSAAGPGPIALQKALKTVGLDINKDVRSIDIQPNPSLAAFRAGQLDANMGSVPNAVLAVLDGTGVMWISGPSGEVSVWNDAYMQVWMTTGTYAKDQPEVLKRILSGLEKTTEIIEKDPETALTALKLKFTDLDDKVLRASFDVSRKSHSADPHVRQQLVQQSIDVYKQVATEPVNVKPEDIVVTGFMKT